MVLFSNTNKIIMHTTW